MLLTLENKVSAVAGDTIEIELKTSNFLEATAIAYGIPLAAMIIGMFSSYYIMGQFNLPQNRIEALAAGIGLISTAIAFICIHLNEGRIKKMKRFTPEVVKIIS